MVLKGNLKVFNVADIFQLIDQQQKSGELVVRQKEKKIVVSFKKGMIVNTSSSSRGKKDLIGNMLVRAGLLSPEHLNNILYIQQSTLKKLGQILISNKFISEVDLKEFLALQAKETIFELLQWKNGEYEFLPRVLIVDREYFKAFRTEHILLDLYRQLDEWPIIQEKVGKSTIVYQKDQSRLQDLNIIRSEYRDEEEERSDNIDRTEDAESIILYQLETVTFDLINGKRDMRTLVDKSRLGQFATYQAVALLLEKGLIFVSGFSEKEKKVSKPALTEYAVREDIKNRVVKWLIYGAMVYFLFLNLFKTWVIPSSMQIFSLMYPGMTFPVSSLTEPSRNSRISNALEIYYLENGIFPETIEQMASEGILRQDDLAYPFAQEIFKDQLKNKNRAN